MLVERKIYLLSSSVLVRNTVISGLLILDAVCISAIDQIRHLLHDLAMMSHVVSAFLILLTKASAEIQTYLVYRPLFFSFLLSTAESERSMCFKLCGGPAAVANAYLLTPAISACS